MYFDTIDVPLRCEPATIKVLGKVTSVSGLLEPSTVTYKIDIRHSITVKALVSLYLVVSEQQARSGFPVAFLPRNGPSRNGGGRSDAIPLRFESES